MEAGVPLRSETLPWSRILETWAERLGLVGKGGGGIWFGWASRLRWVADNAVRWGSRWASGEETDLEVGSKVRGRRVNVGSIAPGSDGCAAIETMVYLLNTLFLFSIRYATLEFIPICSWFFRWFASSVDEMRKRVCQLIKLFSCAPFKPHFIIRSRMRLCGKPCAKSGE